MIYIDPSELREGESKQSMLVRYLSDVVYIPLPGLERLTGADVMISVDGLRRPISDASILYHIKKGSKLLQLKFGHDLPQSIIDNRLNVALNRMLGTGAMSWQCLLTFVGILQKDATKGLAMINGQFTYTKQPMRWVSIHSALIYWAERGGTIDAPLASGKFIGEHFKIHQQHLDKIAAGQDTKKYWPSLPVYYNEVDTSLDPTRQWIEAQKLKPIQDFRCIINAIPYANIGKERATAIYEYMEANGYSMHFGGFLDLIMVRKGDTDGPPILQVKGIGNGLLAKIKKGLWQC